MKKVSINNIKDCLSVENTIRFLVFLLPIGTALVPHWEGTIFSLLFLISIYFLLKKKAKDVTDLVKEEKIILWSMALYFLTFILTTVINEDWGHEQNRYLGVEIRFLFIVPIYLMIRQIDGMFFYFLKGVVLAGILLGTVAAYEVYVLGQSNADGGYFLLYFGSISSLFFILILFSKFLKGESSFWRILSVLSAALLILAVVLSTARMSYLSVVVGLFLWAGLSFKGRNLYVALTIILISMAAMYFYSSNIQLKIGQGIKTFSEYFSDDQSISNKASYVSIGNRFEMWKVSLLIIKENPLFGVGRGGYNSAARYYVDEGEVTSAVSMHSHPHNAYLESFVSRGSLGMLIFLVSLYFPFYVFLKSYKSIPYLSMLGIGFLVSISVLSLTESMVFLRGKFLSVYLVCLICLLSSLFYERNRNDNSA